MAIDFRFWREKETPDSAQDPGWFFGLKEKPDQHRSVEEMTGKTDLKEQAAEATAQKEASVVSSGPLMAPASHGGGLDTSQDPNWFFDQLVNPAHRKAEKDSPEEEL